MIQEFYIRQNSTLPYLRMEVINDGRHDFHKIFNALQDANVTFSMFNSETNIPKILNASCDIVSVGGDSCEEKYIIQYKWKNRDTKEKGVYNGSFTMHFNGNLTEDGVEYPHGDLIVPIQTELKIYVV